MIIDSRHEIFTDLNKHTAYNHLLEFIKYRWINYFYYYHF
jgi:hypothetical protein